MLGDPVCCISPGPLPVGLHQREFQDQAGFQIERYGHKILQHVCWLVAQNDEIMMKEGMKEHHVGVLTS